MCLQFVWRWPQSPKGDSELPAFRDFGNTFPAESRDLNLGRLWASCKRHICRLGSTSVAPPPPLVAAQHGGHLAAKQLPLRCSVTMTPTELLEKKQAGSDPCRSAGLAISFPVLPIHDMQQGLWEHEVRRSALDRQDDLC